MSQDARIKLFRAVLERSPLNKEKPALYDQIIDEFYSLNAARNKFLHGLWYTYAGNERVFLAEATADEFSFIEQREIKIGEIQAVTKRISDLTRKIIYDVVMPGLKPLPGKPRQQRPEPKT